MTTPDLREIARTWAPGPLTVERTLHPEPVRAFAALMDQDDPTGTGLVPPLWHWFHYVPTEPRSELGEDGHPAAGHFLPPYENRRRMMAGGRYRQTAPLELGGTYERRSSLARAECKSGRTGEMLFVTTRHEFVHGSTVVAVEEEDVVYRVQAPGPGRAPAPAPGSPEGARPGDRRLRFRSDPVTLFRFSALTYNAHRIHYDHPYATRVEGYPGLVVHGPLLALAMLELPRRDTPRRQVAEFGYRLKSPLFTGAVIEASAVTSADRWDLAVCDGGGGAPAAEGFVRFAD